MTNSSLTANQIRALRLIAHTGNSVSIEPKTWKSLITRGLIIWPGNTLTDAGRAALEANTTKAGN